MELIDKPGPSVVIVSSSLHHPQSQGWILLGPSLPASGESTSKGNEKRGFLRLLTREREAKTWQEQETQWGFDVLPPPPPSLSTQKPGEEQVVCVQRGRRLHAVLPAKSPTPRLCCAELKWRKSEKNRLVRSYGLSGLESTCLLCECISIYLRHSRKLFAMHTMLTFLEGVHPQKLSQHRD